LPPCRSIATLYHVYTQERLGINLHSSLAQDQSALLDSRLDLPMEFLAVACAVGKRVMPLVVGSPLQFLRCRRLITLG
jgi:hypothetical protein